LSDNEKAELQIQLQLAFVESQLKSARPSGQESILCLLQDFFKKKTVLELNFHPFSLFVTE